MKSLPFLRWTIFFLVSTLHAKGQVPTLIHFQGRLAREQQALKGAGEFKFSLVNSNGSTTFWSNDGTSQRGNEPSNAVPVLVNSGLFSVTLGDTVLPNMMPVSPLVFTNIDVRLRIWFREVRRERKRNSDKSNHSESDDDESEGKHPRRRDFELLTPDQRITSVGYAMFAASVPDGAITSDKLANGAVTRDKLAPDAFPTLAIQDGSIVTRHLSENSVTTSKLADGAITQGKLAVASVGPGQLMDHSVGTNQLAPGTALANLISSGQSGVASGGVLMAFDGNSSALNSAGYVRSGSIDITPERWELLTGPISVLPFAQFSVWTGTEVIAGSSGGSTFGRYDPRANLWHPLSLTGAPTISDSTVFLWTGSEMIVWNGGLSGSLYNPATARWRPMLTDGAPLIGSKAATVWTGSEMLVWGGLSFNGSDALNTGGRYDPMRNQWRPISTTDSPTARYNHTAVWTGEEMIIWGGQIGFNPRTVFKTGARYRPATDTWSNTPDIGAPLAASEHTAIWTGEEMIVWGGGSADYTALRTGARFRPANNSWLPVSLLNAPVGRAAHSAAWTGREMIIWGGVRPGSNATTRTGGRYNPTTGEWFSLTTDAAPDDLYEHLAFWIGDGMLIVGGRAAGNIESYVMHFWRPAVTAYLYQRR